MRAGVTVLDVLERRRAETGDPNLGSMIERALIDTCLSDLEWDLYVNPPELPSLRTRLVR
jgi:hypothetical protein